MIVNALLLVCALSFVETSSVLPALPLASHELHPVEQNIVEQTNAERARYGLPALEVSVDLMESARRHTMWMTNRHSLQHTSAAVGENIAMGQRTTEEALSSWMASPGHRANILNGGYTKIGVAAYCTSDGTVFWCQQFVR